MSAVCFTCWFFNECCCCCSCCCSCCCCMKPYGKCLAKGRGYCPYLLIVCSLRRIKFKRCVQVLPASLTHLALSSPHQQPCLHPVPSAISHPPWWPLKKCQAKCRWQERRRQMIAIMMSIKIMPLSSCCWWTSPATLVENVKKKNKENTQWKKERQKLLELSVLRFKYFLRHFPLEFS